MSNEEECFDSSMDDCVKFSKFRENRAKVLGFAPQREIFHNFYLPYADSLDDESNEQLNYIKQEMGKSLAMREITPGFGLFISRLMSYIKLYDLKFSREDHVKFVKICLNVMAIPNLQPSKLNKCCICLIQLLRKSNLLSPADLEIDWKPLYHLAKIYVDKKSSKGENIRFFSTLDSNIHYVIQLCSPYFPEAAITEILDEFIPQLQPFDIGKNDCVMELLYVFLDPEKNHDLWFDKLMEIWDVYHYPVWNAEIMYLVSTTASATIGLIDWNKNSYLSKIFTKIIRSLELPVTYKKLKSSKNQALLQESSAGFIVSVLGPKCDGMRYFKNLMSTIETYIHPANVGKWSRTISELLLWLIKLFHERLIRERYKIHPWRRQVPDEYKLRDEDVTEFVKVFQPVAFQAMYSRLSFIDVGKMLKGLADLRPELILPGILERVFDTVDSITEPHKYTAALQCLSSVSYVLVSGRPGTETVKTQVIPLLFTVLPGIDSNDYHKTSITMQYIMTQSILIPFVDCSQASLYHELSEEESLICEQTAQFEDFVLQFFDRIFQLIESSSVESTRMEQSSHSENLKSKLETIYEALIQNSTHAVLGQCSQEILDSVSRKLVNYIKSHLLEPKVAAPAMSILCRVAARVNGVNLYRSLMPYLLNAIENHFEHTEDVYEIEKQNDEIIYYLILLMNSTRGHPTAIQSYVDDIIRIIDRLIKCKCKLTNRAGVNILTNLLIVLSTTQTDDIKTAPCAYTKDLKDYLPIRDWGRKMQPGEKFNWFIPGEKEKNLCQKIIHYYLLPILDKIKEYVGDKIEISKDEMELLLKIVTGILRCSNFLKNWTDEPIKTIETICEYEEIDLNLGFSAHEVLMPDGSNVRMTIYRHMHELQEKILKTNEDDILSLKQLLIVYEKLHHRCHSNSIYDTQQKTYKISKRFQEYKLCGARKDIRAITATRVLIQHDLRDEVSTPKFTKTHQDIMIDFIKLSTSRYSVVRSAAQTRLLKMFSVYPFAYRTVIDKISEFLILDPNENHEAFKGALYLLASNRRNRLILRPDWTVVGKLWLSLLKCQLSEKLSILKIMESIVDGINAEFQTIATEMEVSDTIALLGNELMVNRKELPDNFLEIGHANLQILNSYNRQKYLEIVNAIIDYVENNKLHWRFEVLASTMINDLMHPVTLYPPRVSKFYVPYLINDSVQQREIATRIVNTVLTQQKRKHVKMAIDPFQISGVERKSNHELVFGVRKDNEWLQYDIEKAPKSQAEWDEPRYMFKINGFFGWTREVEVYAPSCDQPKYGRKPEELNEHEKTFYEFFSQQQNVDKLIEFWSLEEKKGKEKFKRSRFWMIKSIFSCFGLEFLDAFIKYLPKLSDSKSSESSHRCAAEIMAGIIRGAKHFDYDMTHKLYEKLGPIIRESLNNITNETDKIWGMAFATAAEGMDPMKQYFLNEILLENPLREEKSFIDCSRLYCLQGAFNQHVWRMNTVANRLLQYLMPYLQHGFQNIRERIASTLINIYECDLDFPETSYESYASKPPKIVDLLKQKESEISILMGQLNILEANEIDSPLATALRFFKTLAHFITGILSHATNGNELPFFDILPIAIRLEKTFEHEVELVDVCTRLIAMMAQGYTPPKNMEKCISKVTEISNSNSWSVRLAVLDFLQVQVFNNMPIILSEIRWVEKVQEIVLKLLEDPVVEVREKASEVLGGLLHTELIPSPDNVLKLLKKKCKHKIVKRTDDSLDSDAVSNSIRIRHCGVLGLSAFILSNPYSVPEYVPPIFEIMYDHLHDPQPIPSTIRKTIADFKRTHHDGWEKFQLTFNESQLAVLSELTVPPAYYS